MAYTIIDNQTGQEIMSDTTPANALYWLESQGLTLSEAVTAMRADPSATKLQSILVQSSR
jgi:hypothetical protein